MNSYLAYCYFQDKPHTFLIDFVDVLASDQLYWPKRQSPSPKRRKSNGEVQHA